MARKKKEKTEEVVVEASQLQSVEIPTILEDKTPASSRIDAGALVEKPKRVFKFERLSASMLKVWLKCKRQFYRQYVEGIKPSANTSFTLGTAFHFALEQANLSLKEDPRILSEKEIEDYVSVFINTASSLHVTNMELFDIGAALVRDELQYFIPGEKIIGVEQEFDVVTPEGVRIYGFMDKLTQVDKNTLKITDYKTSNMPMTYEDARVDEQLSMYDLAARILYPQFSNRILELRYVKEEDPDKKSIKSWRSDIEAANFRKQILGVSKSITKYLESLESLDVKSPPPGELNEFCHWCSYRNSCTQYVEAANTQLAEAPSSLDLTDSKFIETYDKVQLILKAAESWKDVLKSWAIRRLEEDPETPISNGKKVAYSLSTTRRELDVEGLLKLFKPEELCGKRTGKPLVKPAASNVQDYVKSLGDAKLEQKVENLISIKFNSPQIRIKKEKGK